MEPALYIGLAMFFALFIGGGIVCIAAFYFMIGVLWGDDAGDC